MNNSIGLTQYEKERWFRRENKSIDTQSLYLAGINTNSANLLEMQNQTNRKREREYTDSEDENTNCEKQRNYASNDIQPISFKVDWAAQWPKPSNDNESVRTHHLKIQDDEEWQFVKNNKRKLSDTSRGLSEQETQSKAQKNRPKTE